ncbi:MAG: cysteine--tRNA ligase [Caldilineales bacterium]|nr:cysteine--tRNA ligase [Caldilineales bacterium]
MRLYNTLSERAETFAPRPHQPIGLYVCGITPYDTTHLGHAFTYSVFDVLIRYLEHQGRRVRYVQNVTDIDDDILRKAGETGEDWWTLGNRWTAHFIHDLQAINIRPPDHYPRATDVIPGILAGVQRLIEAGAAYEANGNVYFHVDAYPAFGQLSHIPRDQMLAVANQRGNIPGDPNKRDPLDFVLWQTQKPGEPAWNSPWGPGRPGWHIECSTMSTQLLGETVDIHGGGGDLAFPHHECEIAQVEPVTGKPFVRFWMHAAMVYHEGEKMSKSLGNLIMIRDLLKRWSPDAIRLYLASHHYRQSWSYDAGDLARAEDKAGRLLAAAIAPSGPRPLPAAVSAAVDEAQTRLLAALDADLDAPAALAALDDYAACLLDVGPDHDRTAAQSLLRRLAAIFGLRLDTDQPEARVLAGWDAHLQRFR